MNVFDLSLDLSKSRNVNPIRLRQGDLNGTTIRALVFDHGALADLSGTTARWVMRLPGGEEYYRKTATVDATACTVTVEVDETQAASVSGRCRGYFQILDGTTVIASTGDVLVEVLPDALEGATVADSYDSAIQEAIDDLNDAVAAIPDTVEDVLEAHPEWVTTVQDGAVTDAKLYQGADGILARNARLMYRLDNLLTNALPEGDSATATDAAKTPLAGLALYGRSTQDGTPTPSAPVTIESVRGNLLDPTQSIAAYFTASGITANNGQTTYYFECEPSAKYTIGKTFVESTDRFAIACTSEQPAQGVAVTSFVSPQSSDSTAYIGSTVYRTITTDATAKYIIVWADHPTTDTSKTKPCAYRGPAPYPYVPYGDMGLWARGKNLLWNASGSATSYGVTFTVNADGSVTCSGTATAQARFDIGRDVTTLPAGTYVCGEGTGSGYSIDVYKVVDGTATRIRSGFGPFTLDAETSVFVRIVVASGATVSATIRPYVYRGSTATAYVPYAETVTPIDLDGHELRSLPDGTRDELTVGADGRVTLVQRVGVVTLGGSESRSFTGVTMPSGGVGTRFAAAGRFPNIDVSKGSLSYVEGVALTHGITTNDALALDRWEPGDSCIGKGTKTFYIVLPVSVGSTVEAGNTWLQSNPVTVQYPLATPVTHDLGWTDAIPLCGPDLVAQAVPAAPFALTYERDLNTTLARLEAAIAALA